MLGLAHLPRVAQYQLATPVSAEARGEQTLLAHPDHLAVLDPVVAEHFADLAWVASRRPGPHCQATDWTRSPCPSQLKTSAAVVRSHRLSPVPLLVDRIP